MTINACRTWLALVGVACMALSALSAPAPLCSSASAEDDPRTARFCQAMNTFLEFYAERAGEQVPEYQGQYQTLVSDYPDFLRGIKRQDVVHSFLRFGRRR